MNNFINKSTVINILINDLQVQKSGHTGIVTVQGNGQFKAGNLDLLTDILNIHNAGTFSASGKGYTSAGKGAGRSSAGGGYGGRGGANSATGKVKGQVKFSGCGGRVELTQQDVI